jgi:hypothetical protein
MHKALSLAGACVSDRDFLLRVGEASLGCAIDCER